MKLKCLSLRNQYCVRKWNRLPEFKSWTKFFIFCIVLIPFGNVWLNLFSLQLQVNRRADWLLWPLLANHFSERTSQFKQVMLCIKIGVALLVFDRAGCSICVNIVIVGRTCVNKRKYVTWVITGIRRRCEIIYRHLIAVTASRPSSACSPESWSSRVVAGGQKSPWQRPVKNVSSTK